MRSQPMLLILPLNRIRLIGSSTFISTKMTYSIGQLRKTDQRFTRTRHITEMGCQCFVNQRLERKNGTSIMKDD
jgi:hypothetical protein